MKSELAAEAQKDSEMYDKMVCWCETSEKEKTKAVADADVKIESLSSLIEGGSARYGEMSAEIANTQEEIAENSNALKQATTLREEAADRFREEEKDMVQAIANLRNAIAVLKKHQQTQELLQLDGPMLSSLRVLLRDAALKYEVLVAGRAERRGLPQSAFLALRAEHSKTGAAASSPATLALLEALNAHGAHVPEELPLKFASRLVEQEASAGARASKSFLQVNGRQPIYESRSSARSSGIYGVLTQMLEEFQAELSDAQKEEAADQESFKAMAAAKEAELDAGKRKLDEMETRDAGNTKAVADAKEDLALTKEQRKADMDFLSTLRLQCNDLDAEWEKRRETRGEETKAVAEAIAILTEDDNREKTDKAMSLLQTSELTGTRRRSAAEALRQAAQAPEFEADDLLDAWRGRSGPRLALGGEPGPRAQLSTLAMTVQLDSFAKVKEQIDKMHAELTEQQAEEAKFKAWCQKELDENEKTVYSKTEAGKDMQTQIEQLEALAKKLAGEVEEAKAQIAATELEIKRASQTREAENAEFQTTVADQRATQTILSQALMKLKAFYDKKTTDKAKVAFAQRASQEPPVKFNSYKANQGASPVIALIEQILEDSKTLESEATSGEAKAQADYETFVKDSNSLIKGLSEQVTSKTKAVASAGDDKAQAGADNERILGELEALNAYQADLHNQCDWLLKNFDLRQKARTQEMEAIMSARAILSGER